MEEQIDRRHGGRQAGGDLLDKPKFCNPERTKRIEAKRTGHKGRCRWAEAWVLGVGRGTVGSGWV